MKKIMKTYTGMYWIERIKRHIYNARIDELECGHEVLSSGAKIRRRCPKCEPRRAKNRKFV